MDKEKRKLEYLLERVGSDGEEIFDALDSQFFGNAEEVLHSFIDSVCEDYDVAHDSRHGDGEVDVTNMTGGDLLKLRWKLFLTHWEPSGDHLRN
tara:strand:+ start:196 stop:477 length:282 start_codon:yes stop_codon:yes gene_type:complete